MARARKAQTPSTRIPIIIDGDPGVDDTLALLLALASPEIDILAIVCTFGNTDIDHGFENLLKIFGALEKHIKASPEQRERFPALCGDRKPVLVRGAERPLEGEMRSAKYFHGRDGLSDIKNRHPDLAPAPPSSGLFTVLDPSIDAYTYLRSLIADRAPHSVTYLVMGPLTTLFSLCRGDEAFGDQVGRVVVMGGAVDVPGNTSPVAEFNVYADPFAACRILTPRPEKKSLIPLSRLTLLPLDITSSHTLPFKTYASHVDPSFSGSTKHPSDRSDSAKSPLVHFTSSILERTAEVMESFGCSNVQLHDPLALWYALENPPGEDVSKEAEGWAVTERLFGIERYGEYTRGMFVVDRRAGKPAFGVGADHSKAQEQRDSGEALMTPIENGSPGGVRYVIRTPGAEIMQTLLLKRIWGVEHPSRE